MTGMVYVPHVEMLLQALRVTRERFLGRGKIAIDVKLLRRLLQSSLDSMPFDPDFYLAHYPDIAEAYAAARIPDLHRHFVETGYFEGRLGAPPPVDEDFYTSTYPDVSEAVRSGVIPSAAEHYRCSGAAEGRIPAPALRMEVEVWNEMLREGARAA